ncbi:hypothetical protein N9K49_02110, partial [Flavobacteriaceae bacterium]|nr:hypothetical protein [Flavobacteriaceae bacterium]
MKTKNIFLLTLLLVFFTSMGSAQTLVRDAVTESAITNSIAFIDGSSNPAYNTATANYAGKGILFPKMDLTLPLGSAPFDKTFLGSSTYNPNHYDGLVVYNTGTGAVTMGTSAADVAPGFYYYSNNIATTITWDTGIWVPLSGGGGGGKFVDGTTGADAVFTGGNVGVGTQTPLGALDITSTNSGIILPRLANTAAVSTPVNGMLIYDISSTCVKVYENGAWTNCLSSDPISPTQTILAQIGTEGDNPDTVNSVVTMTQLGTIVPAITGIDPTKETDYQDYIDTNPDSFSSPATQAEVQAMVDAVNAAAVSTSVLAQIGTEGDNPDAINSVVTVAQLGTIIPAITGLLPAKETAYQNYIDANPDSFSEPATAAEVQAMVDAVNAVTPSETILAQIGTEGDNPDTVNSVVTVAELGTISPAITGLISGNQTDYQDYIDNNPNLFSEPATVAEVQTMVDAVNASVSVLAQIGLEGDSPNTVASVVTVAQLGTIVPAVTGIDPAKETAYQNYIDANPGSFSSPATQAEVQAMITAVNAMTPTQTI